MPVCPLRTLAPRSAAVLLLPVMLLLAALAPPATAQSTDRTDWSGVWDTVWRDGGARLLLEQDGPRVTGLYPLYGGRIEAEAIGAELHGQWFQDGTQGDFVFVMSGDGASFTGRFDSGEWWTGARSDNRSLATASVDQSTPMDTMRSFLLAANQAAGGDLEAIGTALTLVRPQDLDDASDPFDRARALYAVIDQTTLRLWDLPRDGPDGGDSVTVTLHQAGTGETVPVTFQRIGGVWYLLAPPTQTLAAADDRLRAARAAAAGQTAPQGPTSPRDALRIFLTGFAVAPNGADPGILSTLDLRGRPEVTRAHDGQVLAGYLKRVIDRAGYVIWQEIPDDPTEPAPYIHFQHPLGNVVIAPVETPSGTVWRFTPETLATIRAVYAAVEDMPVAPGLENLPDDDIHFIIRNALRSVLPGSLAQAGPLERWQWGALVLTVALATLAAWAIAALTHPRKRPAPESRVGAGLVTLALRGLAAAAVLFAATRILGLPDRFTDVLATLATILGVLGLFLLGWIGVGALADRYRRGDVVTGHNLILLSLAAGVLRGLLLVAALLAISYALSLPVNGVIAGFGIGGIAVALAAQPTLQNLLSGFTLYADRPISVGDFCRFGDKMGTVEYIGLRSTRLRTLDRTVISVPNAQFLDMQLENYARRDRFLFTTTLQLRYETTPDQMRFVLAELRKLLIAHPAILPEPMRVRLAAFGAHSLDVELFCYILAPDTNSFAAAREDLLLRIMSTVDAAGAQFAFPSVVQYRATDTAPDADRVRAAEDAVERWRDSDTLPFPDFEWQTKAELSGTLDYPPAGSPDARQGQAV